MAELEKQLAEARQAESTADAKTEQGLAGIAVRVLKNRN